MVGLLVFTVTHDFFPVLRDLVHDCLVISTAAVTGWALRRFLATLLAAEREEEVLEPEAVFLAALVWVLFVADVFFEDCVVFAVFFLLVALFVDDLSACLVFVICLCTADGRACSDARASGVKLIEVKNRAQSVSETLFIRTTERSPELC